MIVDVGYWTRILKNILVLIVSIILIFLVLKLAIFYMPFLIGFVISLFVEPLIKLVVKKTKLERKKGAIIILAIIFIILLGLLTWGVVTLLTESSNLLQSLNKYIQLIYSKINEYMKIIKDENSKIPVEIVTIIEKSTDKVIVFITNYVSTFLSKVTQTISALPTIGIYTFITLLATYFICTDKLYIIDTLEHQLPKRWAKKIGIHLREIIKSLGGYLKAEAILIIISFFIVLIGLYILKFLNFNVPYPFLTALGIGFVDALPILRFRNGNDTLGNYCSYQWRL
jgi:predicted PurR-regulated permease PerM